MKKNFLCCGLIFALLFVGCAEIVTKNRLVDEGYKISENTNITQDELSLLATKSADKFLKEYKGDGRVIVISEVKNFTNEPIDLKEFVRVFSQVIRKDKKFETTVALGEEKDSGVEKVREPRDNEEFNEEGKIEREELKNPELFLSLEIKKELQKFSHGEKARYYVYVQIGSGKKGVREWDDNIILKKAKISDDKQKEAIVGQSQNSQNSQNSQLEAISSLSFLASQKGAFWLIGLEGGVGERFTPNYNDSAQAAFSFRTKAGGGYRWNADYALSGFLTYEATFQDKGIPYTKNEMETTHSLGFGAMFQFLKYFYVSTGALVDTKDLGSDYISRTHKNINPFIETGGILMTDKYIGFSLGLRYVFALGDGNYLNRGISCSAGILFGI